MNESYRTSMSHVTYQCITNRIMILGSTGVGTVVRVKCDGSMKAKLNSFPDPVWPADFFFGNESRHMSINHVTSEWLSHVTFRRVMSHRLSPCHIWTSNVTHNASWHT